MYVDQLFALRSGVFRLPDGQPARFKAHELGELHIRSGIAAVCDPLLLQTPGMINVPAGDHRVVATIAHVPESYDYSLSRSAYLSLVISDEPTVSVAPAQFLQTGLDAGTRAIAGVSGLPDLRGIPSSDMSSVAITDAEAIAPGMPADPATWFDSVISPSDASGWFDRMDTEIDGPLGSLITPLPMASNGENIAMLIARPDRVFPVLETRDAQGEITGIHIDLLVIGQISEVLKAFDVQDDIAMEFAEFEERGSQKPRGLLSRLKSIFIR
ncbi:hypothetical protein NMP99_11325 [Glutamicibacter mishrai]|uniref:hypothetical protein n=1 Tax=Glutamicibacter mishrai TaxID=1775880 RepID=UPI0020CC0A15|nr:hypothetical protein [Glutamicibacter mishrai]UTT38633.1 hypothetical protein NMP99_11325 [Glutamicibacter mishrai]